MQGDKRSFTYSAMSLSTSAFKWLKMGYLSITLGHSRLFSHIGFNQSKSIFLPSNVVSTSHRKNCFCSAPTKQCDVPKIIHVGRIPRETRRVVPIKNYRTFRAEMFHPPRIPQRQRNGNGTGFQWVPVENPLNADVAPVADPFFQPLLAVVGPTGVVENSTGSLICLI